MSTPLIVGILILLLVVGVPIVQAGIRGMQRRRSLMREGVPALRASGLRREELPAGLSSQGATAVTSEEMALASEHPQATITQLDESGRVIGYRESYRDPRSWGEFMDFVLAQTLHRRRPHRRIELELTRYASSDQANEALSAESPVDESDVQIVDLEESGGLLGREWTRLEAGETVQRMLELRWASGDVLGVLRGDSEPSGHLADDEVRRLAELVRGRMS